MISDISAPQTGVKDASAAMAAAAKSSYVISGSKSDLKIQTSAFLRPRSVSLNGGFFFKTGEDACKNNSPAFSAARADFLLEKIARVFERGGGIAPLGKTPILRIAAKRRGARPYGLGLLIKGAIARGANGARCKFLRGAAADS